MVSHVVAGEKAWAVSRPVAGPEDSLGDDGEGFVVGRSWRRRIWGLGFGSFFSAGSLDRCVSLRVGLGVGPVVVLVVNGVVLATGTDRRKSSRSESGAREM
jgi:hypothetical protein